MNAVSVSVCSLGVSVCESCICGWRDPCGLVCAVVSVYKLPSLQAVNVTSAQQSASIVLFCSWVHAATHKTPISYWHVVDINQHFSRSQQIQRDKAREHKRWSRGETPLLMCISASKHWRLCALRQGVKFHSMSEPDAHEFHVTPVHQPARAQGSHGAVVSMSFLTHWLLPTSFKWESRPWVASTAGNELLIQHKYSRPVRLSNWEVKGESR